MGEISYPAIHHTPTPLTLTMRFTQQIMATFALFSICAYANPMGNQLEVSGQLMAREQATWCGGLTDEKCKAFCITQFGQSRKYQCRYKYVNLILTTTWTDKRQNLQRLHMCKFISITDVYGTTNAIAWSPAACVQAALLTARLGG